MMGYRTVGDELLSCVVLRPSSDSPLRAEPRAGAVPIGPYDGNGSVACAANAVRLEPSVLPFAPPAKGKATFLS
jgi:hypothetical protein